MGYGMGKLQIFEHDGQGELRLEERPCVAMYDGALVDLPVAAHPRPLAPANAPVAVADALQSFHGVRRQSGPRP